ncbi:MAG: shikimate kinase [Clostridium sp.]|nr:shikimate kinase [Clostridium sp.]MCM1546735.1 shikimate kinase [Ruminococcus sp.]
MTVYLCGFMGCGKTTVGKKLAKLRGCGYCDMDELIVKKAGMTIPEIFEKHGEPYFRQMETELIEELGSFKGIVSCGGGAMLSSKNGDIAKKNGVVVFLDVPFNTCYYRISGDKNRPIAASRTRSQLEELYNERYTKYKANSTISIKCKGGPLGIAKNIRDELERMR